jgi:hypothetical protein
MQKTRQGFAILTSILVIIFLVQPIAQIVAVKANPYMFLQFTRIEIISPQSKVYLSPNVDISFEYYIENNLPQVDSFSYSLDNNANSTLANSKSSIPQINFTKYSVFKTLENLPNDNHNLIVYAYFSNKTVSPILNTTIVVDTNFIPPKPVMISPLNQTTYNSNQVPITYTINAKIILSAYMLDTSDYAPKWLDLAGNITLTNLSEGSHKLKLSLVIIPHAGVMYEHHYQTVYFNVESNETSSILTPTPSPTETPFLPLNRNAPHLDPTFYLLPISITVALVVLAVLAYKRRKKVRISFD